MEGVFMVIACIFALGLAGLIHNLFFDGLHRASEKLSEGAIELAKETTQKIKSKDTSRLRADSSKKTKELIKKVNERQNELLVKAFNDLQSIGAKGNNKKYFEDCKKLLINATSWDPDNVYKKLQFSHKPNSNRIFDEKFITLINDDVHSIVIAWYVVRLTGQYLETNDIYGNSLIPFSKSLIKKSSNFLERHSSYLGRIIQNRESEQFYINSLRGLPLILDSIDSLDEYESNDSIKTEDSNFTSEQEVSSNSTNEYDNKNHVLFDNDHAAYRLMYSNSLDINLSNIEDKDEVINFIKAIRYVAKKVTYLPEAIVADQGKRFDQIKNSIFKEGLHKKIGTGYCYFSNDNIYLVLHSQKERGFDARVMILDFSLNVKLFSTIIYIEEDQNYSITGHSTVEVNDMDQNVYFQMRTYESLILCLGSNLVPYYPQYLPSESEGSILDTKITNDSDEGLCIQVFS